MKILDPQAAVLTNVEVLAYLSANPPRRPPNPPPNARRNWVPSPDLRDHNTVVKEIHNYIARISPHVLRYPRFTNRPSSSQSQSQAAMTGTLKTNGTTDSEHAVAPPHSSDSTPMDNAIRDLIVKLRPYKLTKAELVMILNLGLGVPSGDSEAAAEDGMVNGDGAMDVDEEHVNGDGEEQDEGEDEEDGSAMALFDTVIEEREGRMSDEDVLAILKIVKETLKEN
ncbi:hypothetical protein N7509_009045 [Penicillium cosmopolitanum]|uniref:DNA-directed RNA polymerase III subunit RPC9 n=1 Tax=Penicillium cosmopolitanum TaxID=1131564 RepID=A0A9W9VNT7_9EURO|nr:uncharacterized protein N7509_009045 [Penicillium cosmopolitanum]KAJ5386504.1 hypothetical protein N7509_009045 [Penicillium cosmopolitanum]